MFGRSRAATAIPTPPSYAVQRIADQNGQPMTPLGAVSAAPREDFILDNQGNLYEATPPGPMYGHPVTLLTSVVARISDQSIDQWGGASGAGLHHCRERHGGRSLQTLTGSARQR
jgi:hypothetical protein